MSLIFAFIAGVIFGQMVPYMADIITALADRLKRHE